MENPKKETIIAYIILITISGFLGFLLNRVFNLSPVICAVIIGILVYFYLNYLNRKEENKQLN